MPNGARLAAATCLAILAFVVSGQIMPLMPEGIDFGYFTHVNMVLGILCGWIVMGPRVGRGFTAAINNGLTGVAALLFWGLFVQGCYEMFNKAMQNWYDGPFEAIIAIFQFMYDYGVAIAAPNVLVTLLVGAVVSGLLTERAGRVWN